MLTALIDSWSLWNDVAGSADEGMRWRREYLRLTYSAGAYRPYESIVAEAAEEAGIGNDAADALQRRWGELKAWPETQDILAELSTRTPLGIVTNCSKRMGHDAATSVFRGFKVVVTAEEAGFYKPCRETYAKTLDALGTDPARTLFVAGSSADVPGAAALGMPVYWHNRIGLPAVGEVIPTYEERSLDRLLALV